MNIVTFMLVILPAWAGAVETVPTGDVNPVSTTQWGVYSGYPWHRVEMSRSRNERVSFVAELETALFRRFEARMGARWRWTGLQRWSLSTEFLMGGVNQSGVLDRRGPQVSGKVCLKRLGRLKPYLALHDRELFVLEGARVYTSRGTSHQFRARRLSSRGVSVGLGKSLGANVELELAVSGGTVDSGFAIPALHMGVQWTTGS